MQLLKIFKTDNYHSGAGEVSIFYTLQRTNKLLALNLVVLTLILISTILN